jgi:hypothetical protein
MDQVQRRTLTLLSLLGLACGAAPDEASQRPAAAVPEITAPAVAPAGSAGSAGSAALGSVEAEGGERSPDLEQPGPATPVAAQPPCTPPPGFSGTPRTIEAAVALMNALPKPTTLPCFIESLDRPLELYLTSSTLSLQPADGERSPRTFLVLGDLVMSVVTTPDFIFRLELGYRSAPGRSIKGEVLFPLGQDVTATMIEDRIRIGDISICGGCHGAETRPSDSFFLDGAFESSIATPLYPFEVDLESLKAQAALCDRALEPDRCAQLSALFDHGDVRRSTRWDAP